MLVLSRRNRESVVVGGGGGLERLLKVTVLEIAAGRVKLGFEVDRDIPVHRLEIWEELCARGELQNPKTPAQSDGMKTNCGMRRAPTPNASF